MFYLEPTAKKGFTLLEVMLASLLACVIAVGFATALSLAARQRMEARIRTAALVEANSSAEFVLATANSNVVHRGESGFLNIHTNNLSLTLEPSDPNLQWVFDGQSYREQITATNNNNILYFQVSVFCNPTRPVTVRSEAYLKP
jgi:prepilin-type N-terminal cleavage/methylation domain-containing protein